MHEIRATVPINRSAEIARIALNAGIASVSVYEVFVHGPEQHKHVVSVETATPQAKVFIDALLASPLFDAECSITSRELRAIISNEPISQLTRPMIEPVVDVVEDLWQLNHVTASYIGRAAGGSLLLADGIMRNSPIAIVVAALFLPFLPQVLAVGFGIWSGDRGLMRKGLLALVVSTLLAMAAGAAIALVTGGPILFSDFKGPLSSLAISTVIGIAAGLSSADDAGRRYMIGVAAAVQFAVFPVWFGAIGVLGWPDRSIVAERLASFSINVVTISVMAVIAYSALGLNRDEIRRFTSPRHSGSREN
jgi:hypothetical protein